MTAGVLPALKSVFRYTMLNEILDVSENRVDRRKAARNAWMHADTMGVREGTYAHMYDVLRILDKVWDGINQEALLWSWQKASLLPKLVQSAWNNLYGYGQTVPKLDIGLDRLIEAIMESVTWLKLHTQNEANLQVDSLDNDFGEYVRNILKIASTETTFRGDLENWGSLEENASVREFLRQELQQESALAHDESDNDEDSTGGSAQDLDEVEASATILSLAERLRNGGGNGYSSVILLLREANEELYKAKRRIQMG